MCREFDRWKSLLKIRAMLGLAIVVAAAPLRPAGAAGILTQRGAEPAPVAASMAANIAAQQQAAAVAVQSQNELSRITAALQAVQVAQTAARNLALTAPAAVPNGLQAGGLVPDSGLAHPGVANPVRDWTGASTPTQTSTGGKTNVVINQTAGQAILSWNSFNVGKDTNVTFNQQQANWVALNQIAASGVPSQILGSINAKGQVYLINPNGIIFGGASQVNVGALVASTAAISDSQFINDGIYSTQAGLTYSPSFTAAGGTVTVQAGAQITTTAPAAVTTGGGFVLLMGTNVTNAGTIMTPDGQAELAAGDNFLLRPGYSTSANQSSTTRGNEIAVQLDKNGSSLTGGSGAVTNTGVITADTGDITLAGETVTQNGALLSTTSLSVRGSIHLLSSASDPFSNVSLGGNSLTLITPDLASDATALDSQRAALIAQSAVENADRFLQSNKSFDDLSLLPDQEEDSRIEIVSGNTVVFDSGSQTVAQGGQVAASAVTRIQTNNGAVIDVAGTYGVALPVSANDIAVNVQSFETRDDPQNRLTQNLRNSTVYVDDRDLSTVAAGAGGYASARAYTSGGVLEVSGYVNTTGHKIGEWTALGGNITLSTGTKGEIDAQTGTIFNIDGGSIQYQPGLVNQSYLLGENGQVYNVNTAPAYITYAGVYNGFTSNHAAWSVTQTYANVISDPAAIAEPGYTEGRDAGTLTMNSPTTQFNATIDAGAVNGPAQTSAAPAGVTDPYTLAQNVVAEPGSLFIGGIGNAGLLPGTTDVTFSSSGNDPASTMASNPTGNTNFNAGAISAAALGGLNVLTNGSVDVAAPLTFAAGAAVSLFGSAVTIAADITAPSGAVSAGNVADVGGTQEILARKNPLTGKMKTGDVDLAKNAVLNTAGLWTNLALAPAGPNDTAFANGGAVSLASATNLALDSGSMVDASAGAVIAANGTRAGGVGGAVSLTLTSTTASGKTGDLRLDGILESTGFTAGGALTLDAPNFEIGNAPASTNAAVVTLQPSFFTSGFSSYSLTGQTSFDPDITINVVEPTEQFTDASATVPTGGSTSSGATLTLLPLYTANPQLTSITRRPGASLTVVGRTSVLLGAGSAITVDPNQTISLTSFGQLTIDGNLTAPGGTINLTDGAAPGSIPTAETYENGKILSVWIGATSRINAAGVPFTAGNGMGQSTAIAPAGGTINITGNDADVIIQPGAVLDAAGDAATEQPNPRVNPSPVLGAVVANEAPISLASAGGTIALSSNNGLFLYGDMLAPSGGASAAGGTLSLTLASDDLLNKQNLPDAARNITITEADTAASLPADLAPGAANAALVRGSAQISAAQIAAGGFGTLSFSALDAFIFQGNVELKAAQSITLAQGVISDSAVNGSVNLTAPQVTLSGTLFQVNSAGNSLLSVSGFSPKNSTRAFTVDAGLIDITNSVDFGGIETVSAEGAKRKLDLNGFATVNLDSSGDMRFLAPSNVAGTNPVPQTELVSTGNINLTASVVYATASATPANVIAGYNPKPSKQNGSFLPDKTLTISRPSGAAAVQPEDIGGVLNFYAATILDSGVVWNPLGAITFGSTALTNTGTFPFAGDRRANIEFLPGSLTSVSAAGLTVPYGGTTDGINYSVGGVAIPTTSTASYGLAPVTGFLGTGKITLAAQDINISKGAMFDLSGGGNFTGEGFISGESGSVDVLAAPLLQAGAAGGVTQPSLSADPVYAIIAGPQPEVAPVQDNTESGATGSAPAVGAQIIIPAGVPGLPAGRYSLLPASYALNPGGYRVEFGRAASLAAPSVLALPNGSYAVAGRAGVVNTAIESSLPVNLTITPAATVQNYADYDTEGYSDFLQAVAARFGAVRPVLPADAGTLSLIFPGFDTAVLNDAGMTDFTPASGGAGGTLQISGSAYGPGTVTPGFAIFGAAPPSGQPGVVALSAAAIDAFDAATVEIGIANAGNNSDASAITLLPGATLTGARVVLTATTGGITLDDGAEIDTLGRGSLFIDSTNNGPYSDQGGSVLDVGNGYLTYADAGSQPGSYGPITVDNGATIYTDGSIAFSTGAAVNIGADAIYGAAYFDLNLPEINIGDPVALGAAAAPGLTLTQAVLQRLTAGVPAAGVPATQILVLSASEALNFFGTTGLDLSGGNVQLVINSPAIYGFGNAGDVATIKAGTIVWNGDFVSNPNGNNPPGSSNSPGGVVAGGAGTGIGTLDFDANTIIFGYSSLDRATRDVTLNRIALGFSTVNLNATTEITANDQSALAVYQSQATYGAAGAGGVLNLNTPLLTGANGASLALTAGGALTLAAPAGSAPATALPANTAGAEIDLTGAAVTIDSSVILPGGKLDITGNGDVTLGSASRVDLAGDISDVQGTNTYGAGGSLVVESAAGDIAQAAGSTIDVAALNNNAGSVALTATSKAAGTVALDGTLEGSGPTGGGGSFTVRARDLPDFAGLNTALDNGGFFAARSFNIGQGNLTVGDGVAAQSVSISVEGGSLTVTGTINASFGSAGRISLAAVDNLTLAATAVLAANGVVLQTDSYGQPIASADAPVVSLTTSMGELTLTPGAAIDLASVDGIARGDLELNVPRLGGAAAGDANISTASGLNITGAATIAVNAFSTYSPTDAAGTIVQDNGGNGPVATGGADIGFVGLDQINTVNQEFTNAATTNSDLAKRLSGLATYASVFHFRPGVDITSATPNGNLTVQGDLDLSGFRYGPGVNPAVYGSGEPGVLEIRAGGNLNVYGSITDGFQQPINDAGTSYGSGWVLFSGQEPYGQNIVIPISVTLEKGSTLVTTETLNYAVPTEGGTFAAGAAAPVQLTTSGRQVTTVTFVATSEIDRPDGTPLFKQGAVVPAGTVLPNGTKIAVGGAFPFTLNVGPVVWPANTPFTINSNVGGTVTLAKNKTLNPGAIIPGGSSIILPNNAASVSTRPTVAGTQGQLYPLAQLLPAGDLSWSIQLVAGANTEAADPGAVQAVSALAAEGDAGNLTLADAHYGHSDHEPEPAFSVVRTGTGALSLVAGGNITEASDYGVYTAGAQAAPILAGGANPYDLPQGLQGANGTLLGKTNAGLAALAANYQANYPTNGGNVLIAAQGNLTGFISTTNMPVTGFIPNFNLTDTDALGSWLWLQGAAGQAPAWWVEFGAFETEISSHNNLVQLDGFQGIGTLGGGNLTVSAGGNASGLNLAVASTGRVLANGTLVQTGGGNLTADIGGALNFTFGGERGDAGGLITDLRGNTTLDAGSIGTIVQSYNTGTQAPNDPRVVPALQTELASVSSGIDLAPGDGTVMVDTRGDLVIDSVIDPGVQDNQVNTTPYDFSANGQLNKQNAGGLTTFSLWSASTSVALASSGGDITPLNFLNGNNQNASQYLSPQATFYPPSLVVDAENGNIDFVGGNIELAPAVDGTLDLLAEGSIYGAADPAAGSVGAAVSISGADPSLEATPFNPLVFLTNPRTGKALYNNANTNSRSPTLAFGADTPTANLHEDGQAPALILAGEDIVGLSIGQVTAAEIGNKNSSDYVAAIPFDVAAGRDIIASGAPTAPDLFLNLGPGDVTTITAGRDILESSFDIAGPGTLLLQAGRDVYQAAQGVLESVGPLFDINPDNRDGGAGITVIAGTGATGPDYGAFETAYLDPSSMLNLQDSASIIAENGAALLSYLKQTYGYGGTAAGAYARFKQLSTNQQDVFLLDIYFAMLNQSGFEFNEPGSVRYKSYALGRDAIATLFPSRSASGQPISYAGDITLFGGSGIHTDFGGAIQTLTPGGQTIIGVEGTAPPASAGFITQGSGDIDIYSLESVLLGESRVLTTFGGNILIWSAEGDVNAGRGDKTSIDFTPLQRVYDNYGNVALSPTVPSTGAGIGTLNPIPQIAAGNINLVAPLGTVDAGEAGIRVSGNLNIAALHVLNGANIQVQGTSAGVPTTSAVNVGALTTAGNTAGAAAQAAESTNKGGAGAALPSIWIVEILGYGGGDASDQNGPRKNKPHAS